MKREPIALYIFRILMGFGLLFFMCMLYWSSLLIEEDMNALRSDIQELKSEIYEINSNTEEIRQDVMRTLLNVPATSTQVLPTKKKRALNRQHIDPKLPNILTEDPFYAFTLPKLLGQNFRPRGSFQNATVGKPDNLHPFNNWSQVSSWNSMCGVTLTRLEFGKYETMSPDLAIKIEKRPSHIEGVPEFWVHIRDQVYWHPLNEALFSNDIKLAPHFKKKHQVTAHDIKFYWDALMNPAVQVARAISLRNYLGDIEEIRVIDKLTLVIRWKAHDVNGEKKIKYTSELLTGELKPLPIFVYQYYADGSKIIEDDSEPNTYRTSTVWAQNFNEHWAKNIIVSCGAWIFEGRTDRQIRFRRNPEYYFPLDNLVEGMEVEFKNTPDAVWQDFKAGNVDTYGLQPDQLIELETFLNSDTYQKQSQHNSVIKRLDYLGRSYAYIGWNQATPFFKSRKVRQAMTMAIDRERIIQQILNGMGEEVTGTFFKNSPAYDSSIQPWPFDIQAAKRLLEEEGWYDSVGDGVIDKLIDGKRVKFEFSLTYYVKNPTSKAICEYVATALREVGVKCRLNGVDLADLSGEFDDKSFDALFLAWALGTPPDDPRQIWHSKWAKVKGSSNSIGFSNAEADKLMDQLLFESDREKRIQLYHRFNQIIHEEQPYTFLYSPKTVFLYRDYVQNVFIPAERQDLIPGANIAEPVSSIFWLKK